MGEWAAAGGEAPYTSSHMPPLPSLCLLPTPNPKWESLFLGLTLDFGPRSGWQVANRSPVGHLSPENPGFLSPPGSISARRVTSLRLLGFSKFHHLVSGAKTARLAHA